MCVERPDQVEVVQPHPHAIVHDRPVSGVRERTESSRPAPELDIVIVNWNAGRLLRQCLDSLDQSGRRTSGQISITIVDNASSDDSVSSIACVPDVTVIQNAGNVGFATACNEGARCGSAPAILFLNPDTRVSTSAIESALAFFAAPGNEGVGILGIRLCNERGEPHCTTARFPTPWRLITQSMGLDRLWSTRFPPHFMLEHDHNLTRAVDQVMGAFLLTRRATFEALGGFDQRFFLYYEDVDLCLRARALGWQAMHFAEVSGFHLGGGTTSRIKLRRLFLLLRSRIQFVAKHYSHRSTLAVILAILALELPARVALWSARVCSRQTRNVAAAAQRHFHGLSTRLGRVHD
jgi:GT2 family glycosyltransferase